MSVGSIVFGGQIFGGPAGEALTSGRGHVYYALIIGIVVAFAVLMGWLSLGWITLSIIAMAGVFADTYAHGYTH